MKNILVPYDFSEASSNALSYAAEIAKYVAGDIILLHVDSIPVLNSDFGLTAYPISEIVTDHTTALEKTADELRNNNPLLGEIKIFTEIGDPVSSIIDFCEKHPIELIISGIGGHGNAFFKNIVGSTSVTVAKKINIPVLIVPPTVKFKKIANIAYACQYDMHLQDNAALIKVKFIASIFSAMLHVLHVIPENHELSLQESSIDNYVEHALDYVRHKTYIISENKTSDGILNFINHHDVDLVLVESKTHSWLYNLFHISTINAVAFDSPVPVLTIHG